MMTIEKKSPEGQILLVIWRTMIEQAGPISEQYRWILTGIAAILALIIANLQSLTTVIDDGMLKISISLLIGSLFLSSIAYLLSIAVKVSGEVSVRLESILESPEGRNVLNQIQMESKEFQKELCNPLFGPMGWLMRRAANKGSKDQLYGDKVPFA